MSTTGTTSAPPSPNNPRRHPGTPIIGFPRGAGDNASGYVGESGVEGLGCDTAMPLRQMRALADATGIAVQDNLIFISVGLYPLGSFGPVEKVPGRDVGPRLGRSTAPAGATSRRGRGKGDVDSMTFMSRVNGPVSSIAVSLGSKRT
jgi:hypothetical protein